MKVLYFGAVCDENIFSELEKKKQPYFVAQYMYEKALVDELENYDKLQLDVVSIYQTDYYPKDKLIINKNSVNNTYSYLTYVNLPFFREVSFFIHTCVKILKWNYKLHSKTESIIFASNHYPPVSMAIVLLGFLLKISRVVTFTDLSIFTYSKKRISQMKLYKRMIIKPYLFLVNKLQKSYDGYVLFSSYMKEVVNKSNHPYCVVEGIFNSDSLDYSEYEKASGKILAHAGTLNKEVGIDKILDIFKEINDSDTSLWFIGDGDMSETIRDEALKDPRIKHFGFIPKSDVFTLLQKATLLINLRNPNDEYTKYSFPSKMFEYMASGTPVFTTKIQGIPNEYYDYLYSTDSFETEEIATKIMKILRKDDEELQTLGQQAKKFIYQNKSAQFQVEKIVKLLFQVSKKNH